MNSGQPVALRVDLQDPTGRWVRAGVLQRANETTTFVSFDEYWDLVNRPVLGQIFEQRGPAWHPSATPALPTWFSNLLPEGPLRHAIARSVGVSEQREFLLLAHIGGDDLPGALRVVAVEPGQAPLEATAEEDSDQTEGVRSNALKFSLAGVQLKFSVAEHHRGLTVPMRGESGTWIAKLPDGRPGYEGVAEAEFAALELARASGISVPVTRLVDVDSIEGLPEWAKQGGGRAFLIERFDRRSGGRRVHVEELAQVLNLRPDRKYGKANFETVARVTAALTSPDRVGDVIDRIVLNVLVGNGDAHVKNWAYTYPDGRTPDLSPAYDIVPTVLFLPEDDMGLKLNGSRSFSDVDLAAFERLADKAGWDGALGRQRAAEAVSRILEAWPVLIDHLSADAAKQLTERRDSLRALLP